MIDLLDDELPVCRRCGLQLTNNPRLRYQRKIYCFRCAKQVTKPIESREYDRNLHYKQELEIRNQEILNEYERQQDEWKQNRDSWMSQHTPSFGQFFFSDFYSNNIIFHLSHYRGNCDCVWSSIVANICVLP